MELRLFGTRSRGVPHRGRAWLLLLLAVVVAAPARAQGEPPKGEVIVRVGQVVVVALPRLPQRINVEDPTIASITVLPDGRARIRGERVGRTRIIGRDNAQVPIIIPVRVKKEKQQKKKERPSPELTRAGLAGLP